MMRAQLWPKYPIQKYQECVADGRCLDSHRADPTGYQNRPQSCQGAPAPARYFVGPSSPLWMRPQRRIISFSKLLSCRKTSFAAARGSARTGKIEREPGNCFHPAELRLCA